MSTAVMWFRADLRLRDQPALLAAIEAGPDGVVPLFVIDDHFWSEGSAVRLSYLRALLAEFGDRIGGLHIVHGSPTDVVPQVARDVGAETVHISESFTPYGAERDEAVESALADHDIDLIRTGSGYAISPGRVLKDDGSPYRVFTPFYKVWQEHGWRAPAESPTDIPWLRPDGAGSVPEIELPDGVELPPVGEDAAAERWKQFLDEDLDDYGDARDIPGDDRSSRMSVYLKWGTVHPRTLLADLVESGSAGAEAYARELAFREFYADVLHHRPETATDYYNPDFAKMQYDEPGDGFEAWKSGETGYPIVDAGMRQLLAEGCMHNRVRMIVASFLVKDLHIEWQHGAAYFMDRLVDGDVASNQHGWQWVAGCGTDAAPYFRIFNPTTQGKKFDPDGTYVRRYIPQLRDVPDDRIHEPWRLSEPPADYPAPLVDHAEERTESLRRYEQIKS